MQRLEDGPPLDVATIIAHARLHHLPVFQDRFRKFVDRCLADRGRPPLPEPAGSRLVLGEPAHEAA